MHNVSRHERVRPLLQTRVVLEVICSVDDGKSVVLAAGGGEEDLRRQKTVWRADPCYGECQCQNLRIPRRGSRTVRLRSMVIGYGGHDVYQGSGPLYGGKTLLPG